MVHGEREAKDRTLDVLGVLTSTLSVERRSGLYLHGVGFFSECLGNFKPFEGSGKELETIFL